MHTFAKIEGNIYQLDISNHIVMVSNGSKVWRQNKAFRPWLKTRYGGQLVTLYLDNALDIRCERYVTGTATGYRIRYIDWQVNKAVVSLTIETLIWVHTLTGRLYFEILPISEDEEIMQVAWPRPWEWSSDKDVYSVFSLFQGAIIPGDWPATVTGGGYHSFCSVGAPMPWFGQVNGDSGCFQLVETPWDCDYHFVHPFGGPTEFYFIWNSTLGALRYKRTLRMEFFKNCDYNTFCKSYRRYIKEKGRLVTLKQKAISNPKIAQLIGAPIIHSVIYYYIKPEALIYNADKPESNYIFYTFCERKNQLKKLVDRGLKKAYLHLDGWGVDGYDQQHPDIMPPCEKAGGADGMRELYEFCKKHNILFAVHDQYRDYYHDSRFYDEQNAIHNADGTVPGECTWNGGNQSYLCTAIAPHFVQLNYDGLEKLGITPDGAYLDVFSCVPLDECHHLEHRMSRKECAEYRALCLERLRARNLIMSSETAVDTMIMHMELCHHAPYYKDYGDKAGGVPVPLLNLVYHDCIVIPWAIKSSDDENVDKTRFLQALLNGGPCYLDINADNAELDKTCIVSDLQKKVAYKEMVRHEFLNTRRTVERVTYESGVTVTVDFDNLQYHVEE